MKKPLKIFVNLLIFLLVVGFIAYIIQSANKEEKTLTQNPSAQTINSDYEQYLTINIKDSLVAFDTYNQRIYAASNQSVDVYSFKGHLISSFKIKTDVRDITVDNNHIFILYPTFIEKYSLKGDSLSSWQACSNLSNYCAFTLANNFVFVTDVGNKNICKYTHEGNFVQFIHSPKTFITPSHFFDIGYKNDTIYCVNPGRHLIELYNLNGEFIDAFGSTGTQAGFFAGCCNPSYINFDDKGNIITSEKGSPRICSFNKKGQFNKQLLNSSLLGGGHLPYQFKVVGNNLVVGIRKQINLLRLKKQ